VIQHVRVHGFRNLRSLECRPGPRFNVIFGDNGQGKTSLLEAVYYVTSLQSFRTTKVEDMIHTDQVQAVVELFAEHALPQHLRVRLHRHDPREVTWNLKRPRSSAVYRGVQPAVLFHPGDVQLSIGGPDGRRGYMDGILERLDPIYASARDTYDRALKRRNRLLKISPHQTAAIAAFDEILASSAVVLVEARRRLAAQLQPVIAHTYEALGESPLELGMRYKHRQPVTMEHYLKSYRQSLSADVERKHTTVGPHTDDLIFFVGSQSFRAIASQGQHRSLVLAMRIAERQLIRSVNPDAVLLLDDVSSELDPGRNRRLFSLLQEHGGQVFITTTRPEFIHLDRDRVDIRMHQGCCHVT
jgi:DNA replication and repair protein RecF